MFYIDFFVCTYYNNQHKNIVLRSTYKKTPIYFLTCMFILTNKKLIFNKVSVKLPKKHVSIQYLLFKNNPKFKFMLKKIVNEFFKFS